MTLDQLTALFGWMSLINLVFFIFVSLFVMFGKGWVTRVQMRFTGLDEAACMRMDLEFLSRYKLFFFMFNLAPYLALRLVG